MAGLNTNFGQIINIRLRPARTPDTFYDMETLMDTMLHELAHNVFSEHEKPFYGLFEEIKGEWELLSSKGYQGVRPGGFRWRWRMWRFGKQSHIG